MSFRSERTTLFFVDPAETLFVMAVERLLMAANARGRAFALAAIAAKLPTLEPAESSA